MCAIAWETRKKPVVGKNGEIEEQATGEILRLARVCAYGAPSGAMLHGGRVVPKEGDVPVPGRRCGLAAQVCSVLSPVISVH